MNQLWSKILTFLENKSIWRPQLKIHSLALSDTSVADLDPDPGQESNFIFTENLANSLKIISRESNGADPDPALLVNSVVRCPC